MDCDSEDVNFKASHTHFICLGRHYLRHATGKSWVQGGGDKKRTPLREPGIESSQPPQKDELASCIQERKAIKRRHGAESATIPKKIEQGAIMGLFCSLTNSLRGERQTVIASKKRQRWATRGARSTQVKTSWKGATRESEGVSLNGREKILGEKEHPRLPTSKNQVLLSTQHLQVAYLRNAARDRLSRLPGPWRGLAREKLKKGSRVGTRHAIKGF